MVLLFDLFISFGSILLLIILRTITMRMLIMTKWLRWYWWGCGWMLYYLALFTPFGALLPTQICPQHQIAPSLWCWWWFWPGRSLNQKSFNPSACNFHYIIITQSLWCGVHLRLWTPALQFGPLSPIHLCTVMICIFISLRPFLTFWNILQNTLLCSPPHEEWGEHCLSKVLERVAVHTLHLTVYILSPLGRRTLEHGASENLTC